MDLDHIIGRWPTTNDWRLLIGLMESSRSESTAEVSRGAFGTTEPNSLIALRYEEVDVPSQKPRLLLDERFWCTSNRHA